MAKVAFITGATRGIGKQIAIEFAKDGYDIAFNYRKENEDLENVKKQIKELNVRCLPVKGDVSIFDDTANMVNQIINEFGKIDVLVNNAGITKDALLMRMKKEDFEDVINVNLVGTFNVTKNVIPYMIKQRSGRIINISSVVGISGNAGQTNYSAYKAGIIGFTKSLAKEVASRNILVNAVAPGFIETQMTDVLKQEVKEENKNEDEGNFKIKEVETDEKTKIAEGFDKNINEKDPLNNLEEEKNDEKKLSDNLIESSEKEKSKTPADPIDIDKVEAAEKAKEQVKPEGEKNIANVEEASPSLKSKIWNKLKGNLGKVGAIALPLAAIAGLLLGGIGWTAIAATAPATLAAFAGGYVAKKSGLIK